MLSEDEKAYLLQLSAAYKEQIYAKLLEFLPRRLAALEREELEALGLDEVMVCMDMQGVEVVAGAGGAESRRSH